ncbi:MAG: cellulase family glycosylhydrolase [Nakamurella sp.]
MSDPTENRTAHQHSRRGFIAAAAGVGVVAATTMLPGGVAAAADAGTTGSSNPLVTNDSRGRNVDRRSFVKVADGNFTLSRKTFRFSGTNTYYLHQRSHYMIDAALNDAAAMSLGVVRAWAFDDGQNGDHALQPLPYKYDDAAFDSLDYAIYKAGQLGLRLVLALTNNWPDYGGMPQYVSWFFPDLTNDVYSDSPVNHDKFYSEKKIKDCYKAYARYVTRRRNPYTGLRYNDDPTIMTWELANEPRNRSDKTGATVLAWVTEMSAYVKDLAPRQLVAVGDEGFYGDPTNPDYPYSNYEGNQWKKFLAVKSIDYGTVHLYPQSWGEYQAAKPGTDPETWGTSWINSHLADGAALHKPVVIEEYGLQIDPAKGIADVPARDAAYAAWTGAVEAASGASDQFWLLTSRVDDGSFYPDYDGFRIIWQNDPSNTTNSTAQLLSAHAKAMAG